MKCDAQSLLNASACYRCIPKSFRREVQIYLLCRWVTREADNPPDAPLAIDASHILDALFSANWTASLGATSYRLDVSTSNVFASFVPGFQDRNVGNVTTYAVWWLNGSTTYYYRVRAVSAGGTSANSNVITLGTGPAGLSFTPAASIVAWEDQFTSTSGNLAFFNANADKPSVFRINLDNQTLTALTGFSFFAQGMATFSCVNNLLTAVALVLSNFWAAPVTVNISNNLIAAIGIQGVGGLNSPPQMNIGQNLIPTSNINDLLVYLDSLALVGGIFNSVGQTPASPPTGAGLTAKTHLVNVLGWTVTTD